MCHSDESRPPAPPRSWGVADASELRLTSADGTSFMAYQARSARHDAPGAVIFPDMRGLHEFYKALARRLADAGIHATAIDYYGRELPDGPRDGTPEQMFPLVQGLSPSQVAADARAATDRLLLGGGPVFALGFCYGGSQAWNQSAFDDRLAGCIGFYGRPDDCRPYLSRICVPLLMLVGGKDSMTPLADFERFDAELRVPHEMVVYPDAPHAFFDGAGGHDDACRDAWSRLLAFVDGVAA